jgi:transforming growth factor-beta-induced protein
LLQLPNYDGVTIIAPNNEAFEQIPYSSLKGIWDPENKDVTVPLLQYHILQNSVNTEDLKPGPIYMRPTLLKDPKFTNVTTGQNILIAKQNDEIVFMSGMGNRVILVDNDIPFQGGIIHIVDNLLTPPSPIRQTTLNFQLDSFLGGLFESQIMPKLSAEKNITIFAPTDHSLRYVGGSLEKVDDKTLENIMAYHVVPNRVISSTYLTNNTKLQTMAKDSSGNPEFIAVRQLTNNLYINSAQVQQTDILLANGIMHIISNVLNPEHDSVIPNPTVWSQPAVFPESKVELNPFTSAIPCTANCPVTKTTAKTTMHTPTTTPRATPKKTTTHSTSSSEGWAPAKATVHIAGAALGIMGAGMALL